MWDHQGLDSLTFSTLRGRRPPSSDALTGRPLRDAHPPTTHHENSLGDLGDRLCWGNTLGPRRRTLPLALACERECPAGRRAVLRRRDRFGSGKGLGPRPPLWLVRVSAVRCVCVDVRASSLMTSARVCVGLRACLSGARFQCGRGVTPPTVERSFGLRKLPYMFGLACGPLRRCR